MDIDEAYLDYYRGPVSDHFDGEQFFNPWGRRPRKGLLDILKWRLQGARAEWPETVETPARPQIAAARRDDLLVTFIGHATMLVQWRGHNLLIDPVFSDRCSPFSALGPKRVTRPFVAIEKLPPIDTVFVSHNHYDHLDQASLSALAASHRPRIVTPLGNPRLIAPVAKGCDIAALDWHQSVTLGPLTLTLTPAQHWSRRGLSDTSRDLWGGFMLKDDNGASLYYAGDSGYHQSVFTGIKARHGAPDIALLPIGAYEPRWFMKYSHMNPAEAVQAFTDLGARRAMGFHFECFPLADEAFDSPRKTTEAALDKRAIPRDSFILPYPGDTVPLPA